jgi:myo-inositol-1(or 4)-monophosphatase
MDNRAILRTAIDIAHAAGQHVRERFPRVRVARVEFKGAVNPVTAADTSAEALIRRHLHRAFPDHLTLGEEEGGADWRATEGPLWVVDPIDGTANFAHGFPHVGISLALLVRGEPVVGVSHDPLLGETFAAYRDGGATLDGRPIAVSRTETLERSFLATGFPYDRRAAEDNNTRRLDHFLRRSQGVRRAGSAVLDLAYVACGRFDGFWEFRINPWDVAAGVLLVREAGGCVTDFEGGPDCVSGEYIVASNGRVHREMLRVIRQGADAPRPEG